MLRCFIIFRKLELIEEFGENFWLKNFISSLMMLFLYLIVSINLGTSYLAIVYFCMSTIYIFSNKKSYFDSKSIYGFTSLIKIKKFKFIAFLGKAITDISFYGMTFLILIDHFFFKNISPIFFIAFLSMYLFEFIIENSKKSKYYHILFLFYFVSALSYFLILQNDDNFIFKIAYILSVILIQIYIMIKSKFHKTSRKFKKFNYTENKYFSFIQNVFLKLLATIFLMMILMIFFENNEKNSVYEYFLVIYFLNIFSVNFLGKYYNQKVYSMYRFFQNTFYVEFIDISNVVLYYIALCVVYSKISALMNFEVNISEYFKIAILVYSTYQIFKIKFINKYDFVDKFVVFYSSIMIFFSELVLFIMLTSNNIYISAILNIILLFYFVTAVLLKKNI